MQGFVIPHPTSPATGDVARYILVLLTKMATFEKKSTANARYTMSSKALKLNISAVRYTEKTPELKGIKWSWGLEKKHQGEMTGACQISWLLCPTLQLCSLDLLGGSMRMQARQTFITHVRHELAFSFLTLIVIWQEGGVQGGCHFGGKRGWSMWLMQDADWVPLHLNFEWQLQGS